MKKIIDIKKLFQEKKYTEIISQLENNITKIQKNSGILNLLGACRLLRGKSNKEDLSSALEDFRKAYLAEHRTNHSKEAFVNFINVSIDLFEYENSKKNHELSSNNFKEAVDFFEKNEDFFLNDVRTVLAMVRIYKRLVDLERVNFYLETLIKNKNTNPFVLNNYIYNNTFSKNWRSDDFLKYGKILYDNLPNYSENKIVPLKKEKNKKIKIGFLSADLSGFHPVTYFLKSILSNYDSNQMEIFLYLNHTQTKEDSSTNDLMKLVNKSCEILNLSDVEAINLIRNDKIDIIVDLMGVTSKNRLSLIKNRVAPVQILWCGYCNTTGVKGMDYIIADPNLVFENEKKNYSEKIVYLPKIWNSHSGINVKRVYSQSPFVKNKFITFGSFNNFRKINENVISVWSRILKKIPNSKLILKSSSVLSNNLIFQKFKENQISESVEFEPFESDFETHLNLYKKVDVALDTFPYNGVTTSFEAIWMGVPVLTMKGYNFISRCGESINKNLNMTNLISKNENDYFLQACKIASDKDNLTKMREHIFNTALSTPLFDAKDFSYQFFDKLKKLIK